MTSEKISALLLNELIQKQCFGIFFTRGHHRKDESNQSLYNGWINILTWLILILVTNGAAISHKYQY